MGKRKNVGAVVFHWLPVIAWMIVIFTCSSFSTLPDPGGFEIGDKVKHFSAYALLAVLAYHAFGATRPDWRFRTQAIVVLILTGAYGVSDEFHQSFIPGRMCELGDWLADIAGGIAVVLVAGAINYLHRRITVGRR